MSPVIVLTNIPNHYRVPLFNELKRQLEEAGQLLVVLFAAETYERRRSTGKEARLEEAEFKWHILPSLSIGRYRPIFVPRGLTRLINAYRPAALVVAGTGSLALAASRSARKGGVPLLIWTGEFEGPSSTMSRLKRQLKKHLLRRASAVITYGSRSADFVRDLVPDRAIYPAWNTVDVDLFLCVDRLGGMNDGGPFRMVTVGDLVEIKGYRFLLRAVARLNPELRQRLELVIVGDGPQRDELCSLAESLGLGDRVRFPGRRPAKEIPAVLASSDAFVFSSLGEPWGLVLVEAMAAGLPVIASSKAGATRDLVIPGTGLIVDPFDVEGFSEAMASMVSMSAKDRDEMGMRARAHVARLCSLENSAAGFVSAIGHALATSLRR